MPTIPPALAALLSLFHTSLYVGVLYLSSLTRPRPNLPRDTPSHIRLRVRAVTAATLISITLTSLLLLFHRKSWNSLTRNTGVLGIYEPGPFVIIDCIKAIALTAVLFVGPIWKGFEEVREGGEGIKGWFEEVKADMTSWVGWRNLVVAPMTEEVVFRGCMIPGEILAGWGFAKVVLVSPLFFGVGHVHHAYEFWLNHPDQKAMMVVRTLVQFTYTTLFGWYVAFLFVRSGSVWPPILIHAMCNYLGVPSLVLGRRYPPWKRYLYWVLLFAVGPYGFYTFLWSWTESRGALIQV